MILAADHGEALFEHHFIGHNTQLYEESIRVPLMVSLPGLEPRRIDHVVELIDIAPTVLELAGLDVQPSLDRMQGESLVPLLQGGKFPEGLAFSRTLWSKPRYAVRGSRFKFIWDSRTGSSELYHLESDAREQIDLSAERTVVAGFLRLKLYTWIREQEHLRVGGPDPERASIPNDLGRHLGAVGYVGYVERSGVKNE